MKNFNVFGLIGALIILGYHIFNLDYNDLRFHVNQNHYLGIIAMLLVATSFFIGIIKNKKNN
jgi:hypothetical protein